MIVHIIFLVHISLYLLLLQIKGITELAFFVLFLVMLPSSTLALPTKGYTHLESNGKEAIVFHNCREVDINHLQTLMGNNLDRKRMALSENDIDHTSFKERSISNALDGALDNDMEYSNDMPFSDSDDEEQFEDLTDFDSIDNEVKVKTDDGSKPDQTSINYMRRKRQVDRYNNDDNNIDRIKKRRKSKPQNKKVFSQLKKFIRKSKKGKKVKLPWTCRFDTKWIRLDYDFYPPFIQSGSCQGENKCFYDLYDCIPKKYGIKVLRRDPSRCNPIPALGNTTIYEEVWNKQQIDINVACECGISQKKMGQRGRSYGGRP